MIFKVMLAGNVATMGGRPKMHTDGLIAEWRFAEGTGTTVADEVGSNDINLALPTDPNVEWTSTGLKTTAGLIQTPSITGARTVVVLRKQARNEATGFSISGGSSSGSGSLGSLVGADSTAITHVGVSTGVRLARKRADNGTVAYIVNRGGWILEFREFSQAYNTALGFGGRHTSTLSRCATYDIAWAGVYSDQLTSDERTQIYNAVRGLYAKPRGIYLDARDCPTRADAVILWGQSNADGRALIADLSAPDQAQTFAKSYILAADATPRPTPPAALLDLASNQTVNSASTQFGPETFFARQHEDNQTRPLYIAKTAEGSTYLASATETGGAGTGTWNVGELPSASLFHLALTDFYDLEQSMLSAGVGPDWKALLWMQGEQDATQADCAASYEVNLQDFYDEVKTYMSAPSLPIVVGRIMTPGSESMTEAATVRAAQEAFVAANSDAAALVDTDSFTLADDDVHFNAAGQKALGQAFYAAVYPA